jgi:hypothetical protein
MWRKNIASFLWCVLPLALLLALPPPGLSGEEEYRITRSELERILHISGNLEAASDLLSGTRESLRETSETIKAWSMDYYPNLTELGISLGISIERAETLETSAKNSATIVRNLEASILRYSHDLSRLEKSRKFWRRAALAIAVLAAGGITAAVLF